MNRIYKIFLNILRHLLEFCLQIIEYLNDIVERANKTFLK